MKKSTFVLTLIASSATIFIAGCASVPGPAELDALAAKIALASFRDEGPVKVDRLTQDAANRECSAADVAGKPIDEKIGDIYDFNGTPSGYLIDKEGKIASEKAVGAEDIFALVGHFRQPHKH